MPDLENAGLVTVGQIERDNIYKLNKNQKQQISNPNGA
jgi:hypothetical protein